MADDSDLISQVKVEGTEAAAAELEAYAKRGKAAFEEVEKAARKSGDGTRKSSEDLVKGLDGASDALKNIERASSRSNFSAGTIRNLQGLEKAAGDFVSSLKTTTLAIGRFAQRATLMATGIAAVGVAIAKTAANTAKTADGQTEAVDASTKAISKGIDAQLDARTAQIQLASSQRQLQQSYARGEITFEDYGKSLRALNRDAAEARRVSAELKFAQEDAAEAQERLNKAAADRKAYQGLVDTFGGPLTSSMVQFGRNVENIRKQFINAFGPGASTIIDKITETLNVNAAAISGFFSKAGKQFSDFATQNAPAIEKALENIGSAASSVFTGLIAAGPTLLAIFNDGLVPAVRFLADMFNGLADKINSVFGTKLTGGAIAAALAIAQFSGALRLMFALLRTGGALVRYFGNLFMAVVRNITPFGLAVTVVVAALTALYKTSPGFKKFVDSAVSLLGDFIVWLGKTALSIGKWIIDTAKKLANGWSNIEKRGSDAAQYISDRWSGLKQFFVDLWTTISNGAAKLWQGLKDAPQAAATFIEERWNGLKDFFAGLWTQISTGAAGLWESIKAAPGAAADYIAERYNALKDTLAGVWETIRKGGADLWKYISDNAGAAWDFIAEKWVGAGEYFSGLWLTITDGATALWDWVKLKAGEAWDFIVQKWTGAGEYFAGIWTQITTSASDLWEGIKQKAAGAWEFIKSIWDGVIDYFVGIYDGILQSAQDVWDRFVQGWQDVYNRVAKIFTDLLSWAESKLKPIIDFLKTIIALTGASSNAGSDGAVRRAGGGAVRGPGTSTGDKIPAWLSNNEFVIRARAVRKYGADFLNAVNSGRFDIGKIARFAAGGLVDTFASMGTSTPRYAFAPSQSQGPKRPGATVNLSFDGKTYQLMAPADIADGLAAHATSKAVTSSGRKPAYMR